MTLLIQIFYKLLYNRICIQAISILIFYILYIYFNNEPIYAKEYATVYNEMHDIPEEPIKKNTIKKEEYIKTESITAINGEHYNPNDTTYEYTKDIKDNSQDPIGVIFAASVCIYAFFKFFVTIK